MVKLVYDESETLSYGHYRCETCKAEFYGGGPAIHKADCANKAKGHEGLTFVIGREAVAEIKDWAKTNGEDRPTPLTPVSLRMLREQLPQCV